MQLPNEMWYDALVFMDRPWLERLQMVSRRFRDLIRRHFPMVVPWRGADVTFRMQFSATERNYVCSLSLQSKQLGDRSSRTIYGPIERFEPFLLADRNQLISVEFILWGGERSLFKPKGKPITPVPYDILADRLTELRPAWMKAKHTVIQVNMTDERVTDEHIRTSFSMLKVLLHCTHPTKPEPSSTSHELASKIPSGVIFFADHCARHLALLNADPKLIELLSWKGYDNQMFIYEYSDEIVDQLAALCHAMPASAFDQVNISLGSDSFADRAKKVARIVKALRRWYTRTQRYVTGDVFWARTTE